MEPANIDWKSVSSRFVRDEVFENINAPMWLDLTAPDAVPVDDDAWFCRPDCKHPKTVEDFKLSAAPSPRAKLMRSSSERLPFGERNSPRRDDNNMKRRGGLAAVPILPASPLRPKKPASSKQFREDHENHDPNQRTPPRPSRPLGAPKGRNAAKDMIKSSAEKKVEEEREERKQGKVQPRLRSTMSARNLFSGKDILSQISEFCHELKKMTVGSGRTPAKSKEEAKKDHKAGAEDRKQLTPKKDDESGKKSIKRTTRVEIEKPTPLKEIRAHPPTPQRFPSPSTSRCAKATITHGRSPLNKPPKSGTLVRTILQEVEQNTEEKKALLPGKEDEEGRNTSALAAGTEGSGSSADLFWFLKPCTYLK